MKIDGKVRLCIIMIDYDCEDFILQMFHNFLIPISEEHDKSNYDYMRIIMASIINESDVIFQPIISLLLAVLKRRQFTSTAAYNLVYSNVKGS